MNIACSASYPNLNALYPDCDRDHETSYIILREYKAGDHTENVVRLDSKIFESFGKLTCLSWCQTAEELKDTYLLFAAGFRSSNATVTASVLLIFVDFRKFTVVASTELPSIAGVLRHSKAAGTGQESTVRQINWQPNSRNTLAASITHGAYNGIFVWRDINLDKPSNSPEPKLVLHDEVASFEWFVIDSIHFLTKSHIKCFDIFKSHLHFSFDVKSTAYNLKVDPFMKRVSFFEGEFLYIYQSNTFLHSISFRNDTSRLFHEWNPRVRNQLVICLPRKKQLCLVDLFYTDPSDSCAYSIPPSKRYFDLKEDKIPCAIQWSFRDVGDKNTLLVGYNFENRDVATFDLPVYMHSSGFDQNFNVSIIRKSSIFSIGPESYEDISVVMHRRALGGYGPFFDQWPEDLLANSPHLEAVWKRLHHLKKCLRSNFQKPSERLSLKNIIGLPGILDILNSGSNHSGHDLSENNVKFFDNELDNIVYDTIIRKHGLSYCEWEFKVINDAQLENLERYINEVHDGKNEVGAALAWVHSRSQLCLTYLDKIPNAAFSLALTGLSSAPNSQLWLEKCSKLSIDDPYLRIMFGFLAKPTQPKDVLRTDLTRFPNSGSVKGKKGLPGMRLEDHVAFAFKLLPENELPGYMNELTKLYTEFGDLDGLFLTGVTPKAIELLQSYLDRTCDIQTVVLILLFANSKTAQSLMIPGSQWDSNPVIAEWIEEYRNLLDSWQLFKNRADFDFAAQFFTTDAKLSQIVASCVWCSVPFNNSDKKDLIRNPNQIQRSNSEPKVTHACNNCGNFLPRCSVCLQLLGTASLHNTMPNTLTGKSPKTTQSLAVDDKSLRTPTPSLTSSSAVLGPAKSNPFSSWFVWCNSCSHGGHAAHVSSWFSSHSTCPVEKCKCRCSGNE